MSKRIAIGVLWLAACTNTQHASMRPQASDAGRACFARCEASSPDRELVLGCLERCPEVSKASGSCSRVNGRAQPGCYEAEVSDPLSTVVLGAVVVVLVSEGLRSTLEPHCGCN